mmetsp:Transcript_44362/g.88084  ORF Transcript_44362/g.88084 Transcript_44362/m.88084 type:complete len:139 (-) Transcript_44362:193-609(-)
MYSPKHLLTFILLSLSASSLLFDKSLYGFQRVNQLLMSVPAKTLMENAVKDNKVMVFSKSYCPYCMKTKSSLQELGLSYGVMELDKMTEGADIQAELLTLTKQRTVPNVFVNGKHIGGNDATQEAIENGTIQKLLRFQ